MYISLVYIIKLYYNVQCKKHRTYICYGGYNVYSCG